METLQHQVTIPEELDGQRLDRALATLLPDYSRSRLKDWILGGCVLLDGEQPVPRTSVRAGQAVSLVAELESETDAQPEPMRLDVAYEDDDVLVIDKPAGLVVHPGAGNPAGTLMNGLLHHSPSLSAIPRSGILHRLDKDTSGLLVVAKTLPAHTRLVRDLERRDITREYRAVCTGRLTAGGHIDAPIGRHPINRTRMTVTDRGRPSVTHYRILERFPAHTFMAVRLETGRTHQIRVHMAQERHALVGDSVYGGRLKIPAGASPELTDVLRNFSRQALHASGLSFTHPVSGEPVSVRSPLPDDFVALLGGLAGAGAGKKRWNDMSWPEGESR
jgi:23S rRNA pseudouridine1911/1915/1917 synthase